MKDFQIIYKILSILDKHKGDESFDYAKISAEAMKTEYNDWEQLMIEMQENGFIRGLIYSRNLSDKFPHLREPICPVITLKGMEYLAENNMMAKAKKIVETAMCFKP